MQENIKLISQKDLTNVIHRGEILEISWNRESKYCNYIKNYRSRKKINEY